MLDDLGYIAAFGNGEPLAQINTRLEGPMTRTTPPRPYDIVDLFPEIAEYAKPAVRLHPRRGTPTVHESSIGGPLLWPEDEPWPMCDLEHDYDQPTDYLDYILAMRRYREDWDRRESEGEKLDRERSCPNTLSSRICRTIFAE
ncbi:hypothetical protein OHB12_17975 [Nocardia sp. NBC_01730]|uniref:hypothetical protein n=1 Tax=Nocardia sp. NBC_01730 TaxID=2975998 RepID=UPI002E126A9C|nr:hypothetical protein OHB12_17975 [Nocardia sp. NBC_01730]